MKIDIPKSARHIIDVLYDNGYEAFIVGGCVRDSLMGIKPKDWDITTSASPMEIKRLFSRTVDTGIQHGTVTVLIDKIGYEVTTYRIDGEYKDSRHPEDVIFTKDLIEDLKRRDFTINAMAYNDRVGIVDKFNGIDDLKKKLIKCVGIPQERFSEDALRILRAIRFSAQLDFTIDGKTRKAIQELSYTLANISAERIKVEMDKILLSSQPAKIRDACVLGLTKVFLPEFDALVGIQQENPNHMYNVDEHTLHAIVSLSEMLANERTLKIDGTPYSSKEKLMMMWTMLLHDIGKPSCKYYDDKGIAHFKKHDIVGVDMASKVYARLKFDRYTSDTSKKIIKWHDYRFTNTPVSMRRAMNRIGTDIFDYLFLIKRADTMAQNIDTVEEKLKDLEISYGLFRKIYESDQCVSLKELAISGADLIEYGIKPGKEIGEYLKKLLEMVIDKPELNKREILLEKLKELK